ncbi:MAG TPA: hypothetical protein VFE01_02980, partial [Terracidiphilus sp.]|nr:hypothetical protein [Terracidiphilus sp.]
MAFGMGREWWPSINNHEDAVKAMKYGAYTAALSAGITASASITGIYLDHPVLGMGPWALVDAVLLSIVAWRVYRLSLPWSIVGLLLFTFARLYGLAHYPHFAIRTVISAILFVP